MIRTVYVSLALCLATGIATRAHADETPPARPTQPLPGVTVFGDRIEDNYRIETVDSIGPLGSTPLLDIPYTVSVLPFDMIENSQAVNFKDVSKYLPLVAYQEQQARTFCARKRAACRVEIFKTPVWTA